jgi:AraC family transcriptional regulator
MSLNKPATGTAERAYSGAPRWYLWEGGFLAVGTAAGVVPPHSHHAIQVVIAVEGETAIRGKRGDWQTAAALIVRPDVEHSFDGRGFLGAMLLIDPEAMEGVWLRKSVQKDITLINASRVAGCAAELRRFAEDPFNSMEVGALISHCVQSLCMGVAPTRSLDPRVTRVLGTIRKSEELRMSIEEAADIANLSPSRFAHLFKQQVGLPFRRYMLWRKLARAMVLIGRQQTISTAAHEADFSDAAHLTRTFYQMFGMAPSILMRGEFVEIQSPFAASGE